jgi:hypothetical protein
MLLLQMASAKTSAVPYTGPQHSPKVQREEDKITKRSVILENHAMQLKLLSWSK